MNIVQMLAHNVEEADQLSLLTSLGYNVFSIGGFSNPAAPVERLRPALPDVPYYPDLEAACHEQRVKHEADGPIHPLGRPVIDWAKADLPQAVLDWADVIICHHFEQVWLAPQWPRLRASGKRIIWRTVGQSNADNERVMGRLEGLEIVRYSAKERSLENYAGETALIRFYKDPAEWKGWTGDEGQVINVTQRLYQRHPATNWEYWDMATDGLERKAIGEGSELIGGTGTVPYEEMRKWLRYSRAYLYTGTQPASYTLGLIEALMTGIPVVSIGSSWMQLPELFEGHELAPFAADDPSQAQAMLRSLLDDHGLAKAVSAGQREAAIATFGKATVGAAWRAFLG